jgi:hypothetical protein
MQVLQVFFKTGFTIYIRNRYHYRWLIKDLESFSNQNQIFLDNVLKKRMRFYTMQSALTNLWFSTLRGKPPSTKENKCGLFLGAYTPVYDDLMDHHELSHAELTNIKNQEGVHSPQLLLLSYLKNNIIENIKDEERFNNCFAKLGVAQDNSTMQFDAQKLPQQTLEKIMAEKGGYATLLYRSIMDHPLKAGEEEAILQLGGALQLINDAFDIYKDHQQGIQTLLTTATDIHAISNDFDERMKSIFTLFTQLDYKPENIRKMLMQLATVLSRGKVCLQQLQLLQNDQPDFEVKNFTRKELICDMEKSKNIKSCIAVCRKWSKEW